MQPLTRLDLTRGDTNRDPCAAVTKNLDVFGIPQLIANTSYRIYTCIFLNNQRVAREAENSEKIEPTIHLFPKQK